MSKPDSDAQRKEKNKTLRWVIGVFLSTIIISGTITYVSGELMESSTIYVALIVLLAIVFIGVIADTIGVAITSADEKPFHSMAARKVSGAQESIRLLRNAERVTSICNDVIGDICGVVSGSASAAIAAQVLKNFTFSWPEIVSLLASGIVAGLTVGGKAIGKSIALRSSTAIVQAVGKMIWFFRSLPKIFKKNDNKDS